MSALRTRKINAPKFTGNGPLPESAPWDDDDSPAAPVLRFPATHKQIVFLVRLASDRGVNLVGIVCEADPMDPTKIYTDPITGECVPKIEKRDASAKITAILNGPKPPARPATPTTPASAPEAKITEAGMYRNPTSGKIYKVQKAVHGSGHLYAKELVVYSEAVRDENDKIVTPAEVGFEMARGMIFRLKPEWKMTMEESKIFGALYGSCCSCARTLTLEDSIYNGYGKTCAGNNGWPYEKAPKIQLS